MPTALAEDDRWMARTGDQVVIRGRHVDDAARTGLIVEVRGAEGAPPYRVRFADGHEALVFPGADCVITRAADAAGDHEQHS